MACELKEFLILQSDLARLSTRRKNEIYITKALNVELNSDTALEKDILAKENAELYKNMNSNPEKFNYASRSDESQSKEDYTAEFNKRFKDLKDEKQAKIDDNKKLIAAINRESKLDIPDHIKNFVGTRLIAAIEGYKIAANKDGKTNAEKLAMREQFKKIIDSDKYLVARLENVILKDISPEYDMIDLVHNTLTKDVTIPSTGQYISYLNKVISNIFKSKGKEVNEELKKYSDDRHSMYNKQVQALGKVVGLMFGVAFPKFNVTNVKWDDDTEKGDTKKLTESVKTDGIVVENNKIKGQYKGVDVTLDGKELFTNPIAMLITISNKYETSIPNIEIPDEIQNIVKIQAIAALEGMQKLSLIYPGHKDFDDVFGLNRADPVMHEKAYPFAAKMYEDGQIPVSSVVNSLGSAIYNALPYKFAANIDIELKEQAIVELGLLGLQTLHNAKLISLDDSIKSEDNESGSKYIQNPIRLNKTSVDKNGNRKKSDEDSLIPIAIGAKASSMLAYIGLSPSRIQATLEPKKDAPETARNSFIKNGKEVKDRIIARQQHGFKFSDSMKFLARAYKENSKMVEDIFSLNDIDSGDKSNYHTRVAEIAKKEYDKMQLATMFEYYERFGDKTFYMPVDFTVSGRYMIDSNLNPQESKITRFLLKSGLHENEGTTHYNGLTGHIKWNGNEFDKTQMHIARLAVAQAFDLDPDKTTDISALKELDSIVKIADDGRVTYVGEKGQVANRIADMLDKLENMQTDIDKLEENGAGQANHKTMLENSGIKFDELKKELNIMNRKFGSAHALQAIDFLRKLDSIARNPDNSVKEKGIETNLTIETDGITSGMGINLVQIGSKEAYELAAKAGIYTKEITEKYTKVGDGLGLPPLSRKDGKTRKLSHGYLRDIQRKLQELDPENENDVATAKGILDKLGEKVNRNAVSQLQDHAAFNDVYMTVADVADKELKTVAETINDDIANQYDKIKKIYPKDFKKVNKAKRELQKMIIAKALLSVVPSISRKIAKPSVMTYIYGSLLSSIKRNLVRDVFRDKMYELLANTSKNRFDLIMHDLYSMETSYSEILKAEEAGNAESEKGHYNDILIKALLGNYKVKENEFKYMEMKNGEIVQAKAPEGKETLKNLVITENMLSGLRGGSDLSVGRAFEKGFEQFKIIDDYRNSVKALEVVRFDMFQHALRIELAKITEAHGEGYAISEMDIVRALDRLEHLGLGHSIPTIYGDGQMQPLYKREKSQGKNRAIASMFFKQNGETLRALRTAAVKSNDHVMNSGAAAVTPIHSIDGFVDSFGYALFHTINVYDGIVAGINSIDGSTVKYNEGFAESMKFDTLQSQIEYLAKALETFEKEYPGVLKDSLSAEFETKNGHNSHYMTLERAKEIKNTVNNLMNMSKTEETQNEHKSVGARTISLLDDKHEYMKQKNKIDVAQSYVTDTTDPVQTTTESKSEIDEGSVKNIYDRFADLYDIANKVVGDKLLDSEEELAMEYEAKVNDSDVDHDNTLYLKETGEATKYVNHSGGAKGSDYQWGIQGEKYGVTSNHYYKDKTPYGNTQITDSQFIDGLAKAKSAAKALGRNWSSKPYVQGLLSRNWQQVKNSDAVFAIGTIEGKQVSGGTGYAVEMAIQAGKDVYVFDQTRNNWYSRSSTSWTKIDTPTLSKNFAGIGTREINANGIQAIKDVYEKTFNSNNKSDTEQSSGSSDKKQTGKQVDVSTVNAVAKQFYDEGVSAYKEAQEDIATITDKKMAKEYVDLLNNSTDDNTKACKD